MSQEKDRKSFGRWLKEDVLKTGKSWHGLVDVITRSFMRTYTPDSFGESSDGRLLINGKTVNQGVGEALQPYYLGNPKLHFMGNLTASWYAAAGFFNLPNRVKVSVKKEGDTEKLYSRTNLIKNFIGWPDDGAPRLKQYLSYVLIIPTIVWNIVSFVVGTAWNIVKLATEFLPLLIANLSHWGFSSLYNHELEQKSSLLKLVYYPAKAIGLVLLGATYLAASAVHLVGRCITSPLTSVQRALSCASQLKSPLSGIVGAILVTASVTVSVIAWTLIFVGTLGLISLAAPAPVVGAVHTGVSFLNALPGISHIGIAFSAMLKPLILGLGISAGKLVAAAAVVVIGLPLGMVAKHVRDEVSDWWYTLTNTNQDDHSVVTTNNSQNNRRARVTLTNDVDDSDVLGPARDTVNDADIVTGTALSFLAKFWEGLSEVTEYVSSAMPTTANLGA